MRFGVVGTNFVSDFFMTGAGFVPEIQVTSVCSGHRENAEKFVAKYGIPNVYDDYIEMMESGSIDAIYLAVPNQKHYEMTLECLKRHIPTFCEKPMGGNLRQVREMIQASIDNGTYLHDGTIPMYSPNLRVIREYLGRIGRVRRALFNFGKYSSRYDAYLRGENPTTFRPELYNGSLMDLGIYVIADIVALFGKPQEIYSEASILESGADCMGVSVLKYDGFDAIAWHSKVTDTEIVSEIQGEQGNIYIPHLSLLDEIYYQPRGGEKVRIGEPFDHQFANELRDFVYGVENGLQESVMNPFRQVLDIHEVLTDCRLKAGIIFDCDGEDRG
ncbi:MAG: Gfo/Idh/MocA family oxidoreductase [Erysipelotrichaceae bacterium]|nr:Gfo/Idh/MocA family oxidoreductase [Erysipelotrichaceae bacterium]